MKRALLWWVDLWSEREHPRSLALLRILLAVTVLYDFVEIARLDLVLPLLAPQEHGGWADLLGRQTPPLLYRWLPGEAWVAHAHHGLMCLFAFTLLIGLFTRTSALGLLLLWAQVPLTIPQSDRAIDLLVRNVLLILVFSGAGATWSVDARIKTGSFAPRHVEIGAWARYLVITQLVVMYFTAGVQKVGILWLPMGSFAALYVILQDPAIARFDFSWLRHQPGFFLTQLGTVVTMLWQIAYPLVLLWYWYKNTPDRPGRLRAFANRWRLHLVWIAVGAVFHLLLAATMELGIFPWAMLAIYPAFVDPDELRELGHALWRRLRPGATEAASPSGT